MPFNGYCPKDHLIGCERACFVSEDTVNESQLLYDRGVKHTAMVLECTVIELAIQVKKQCRKGLDAFDEDVERDGNEEIEQEEDSEEHEHSCIDGDVHSKCKANPVCGT